MNNFYSVSGAILPIFLHLGGGHNLPSHGGNRKVLILCQVNYILVVVLYV